MFRRHIEERHPGVLGPHLIDDDLGRPDRVAARQREQRVGVAMGWRMDDLGKQLVDVDRPLPRDDVLARAGQERSEGSPAIVRTYVQPPQFDLHNKTLWTRLRRPHHLFQEGCQGLYRSDEP